MFACQAQDLKYVKYNRLHKTGHYCQFAWYYKVNFKINPSQLETKQVSYASPPVQKLHLYSDIIFKLCKPAFHSGHLSHNMPSSSTATIRVFHLP